MAHNRQQPIFKTSFLTMDSTLLQDNNSLLYFRNMQGPRDSSNNVFFSLQPAIGNDPSLRINKHNSTGTIVQTGYLLDTQINQLVDPTFSTVTVVGNGSVPQTLFDISSSTCKINVINTTGGVLDTNFCNNINDATGLNIDFLKTRNFLVTSNNDTLGSINFYGRSVTNNDIRAAYIAGVQDGNATSTNVPGRLEFVTRTSSGTETEKMRIDQDNILIKGDTTSAGTNPFGGSTDNGQVIITGITTQLNRLGLGVDTVNSVGIIQAVTSGDAGLKLGINNKGGNVGIGTLDPLTKLQVSFASTLVSDWFISNGSGASGNGFGFWTSMLGKGIYINPTTNNITVNSTGSNAFGAAISNDSNGGLDFFTSFIGGAATTQTKTFSEIHRMRIDANGNVGINVSTPLTALDISGSQTIRTTSNDSVSNFIKFTKSRSGLQTSTDDELGYISFFGKDTNNIDRRGSYILANQSAASGANYIPGKLSFSVTDTTGSERTLLELNASKQVVLPDTTTAATGPNLNFNKSRNFAATALSDSLGQVVFNGVDTGTVIRTGAYIEATQTNAAAAGYVSGKMVHYTTNASGVSGARLTVESDGVTFPLNIRSITTVPADWSTYYNKVLFVIGPATSFNITALTPDAGTTLTFRNAIPATTVTITATNPATVIIPVDGTAKFVYVTSARVTGLSGWYQYD